jgi:ribosomal protein S18 acetylase RimI-like enzyme
VVVFLLRRQQLTGERSISPASGRASSRRSRSATKSRRGAVLSGARAYIPRVRDNPFRPAPPVQIREATPSDHQVYARLFVELAIDDPIVSQERFDEDMLSTTLIAERGGAAVGYAYYRPMGETVHLSHIAVEPAARRTGVGRALIDGVVARSKGRGFEKMRLNVKPANTAAIALYRSFGLEARYASRAFKLPWALIEAMPIAETPTYAAAVPIEATDDARLEKQTKLIGGILADQRTRPGRVLLKIEREHANDVALGVFDRGFPGVYPIRAPDGPSALSLIRAFRPHARPEDAIVHVMVEDQPAIAEALLRAGASLKIEVITMDGAFPAAVSPGLPAET